MKRKIDIIVKYFYPVTAGIETNILETYSVLAKRGWDVDIHTSKDTYDKKNSLPEKEIIRGLKVSRYRWGKLGFFPKIDWDSTDLVCLHNFDVFPHFQILIYTLLRKIFGKKNFSLVVTPHGGFSLDLAWSVFPLWQKAIKEIYNATLGKRLINLTVDAIRAVSEWERQDLIKKGIKSSLVAVIANGLENEAYMDVENLASKEIKAKVKSWGKYIIQIGRIYPIKNYETTIRALRMVHKDINFVIVGPVEKNQNPEYFNRLQSLILKMGLTKRVIFAGVIREVDKYYTIKKAQMMVHMAVWESFCNVVHEGLAMGLPLIVANNTALPLLVKDRINGYLVETKDYKKVSERINYVLDHLGSIEIMEMKKRNEKQGKAVSWKNVALRMDSLYRSLLS